MNILFICTGNLNRSPAAQTILKSLSRENKVFSAGTHDVGKLITTLKMRNALKRAGYKYNPIYSKPVTKEMIKWADIILYMQPSHLTDLLKITKSYKYINLAHFINKTEIHDPHYENAKAFDAAVKEIEMAIKNFLKTRK